MRADSLTYQLASNASGTQAGVSIRGGFYLFMANGTAGGSTISLQIQMPDNSWCDVAEIGGSVLIRNTSLPFTATRISLPAGNVRMAATGGTPSALNAWLSGIG